MFFCPSDGVAEICRDVLTATDGGGEILPAKERSAVASSVTMLNSALKPSISITNMTLLGTRQNAMWPPMLSNVSAYFKSVPSPVEELPAATGAPESPLAAAPTRPGILNCLCAAGT